MSFANRSGRHGGRIDRESNNDGSNEREKSIKKRNFGGGELEKHKIRIKGQVPSLVFPSGVRSLISSMFLKASGVFERVIHFQVLVIVKRDLRVFLLECEPVKIAWIAAGYVGRADFCVFITVLDAFLPLLFLECDADERDEASGFCSLDGRCR